MIWWAVLSSIEQPLVISVYTAVGLNNSKYFLVMVLYEHILLKSNLKYDRDLRSERQ